MPVQHELTPYPDPAVKVLDPRFAPYRLNNAAVDRPATGFRWTEGPVWFGDHHCLLFRDIPNDRILRWDEASGAVSVYRHRRTTPTGTSGTAPGGWSPANTRPGG